MVPRGKSVPAAFTAFALASFVFATWTPTLAPTASLASVTTVNLNGVTRAETTKNKHYILYL